MIDRARVEQHVTAVLQMVDALRRHQTRTVADLENDIDLLATIAHEMQIGIQSAIDAGAHVRVASGLNEVQEYRQVPERLAAHGVVPADLGAAVADLARFRNVLVHHYLLVRVDLVHEKLQSAPRHLEEFTRARLEHVVRIAP